jgi:DNA-binding ferritin-like protein
VALLISNMKDLIVTFRAAQFVAHNAHNLAKGATFFEDHEFFGEAYAAYESAYDATVERAIGLGMDLDLNEVTQEAAKELDEYPVVTVGLCYQHLLNMEREICNLCAMRSPGSTLGTQNLLAQFCDDSEVRQYKIQRKLQR